ncbi:heavy metal-associated isoprenylated plant protein 3-like, partial [Phalaenopsis equestris]|uniref:heavy metal-associated isoprenylated plant protein 3-like n=1 Tax=Phalaenopsis equestris TaxID=78828 RepID=UPI0009E4AADE
MGQEAEKEKEDVDGGKKKEEVLPVVIFKVDVHCDGCASKIRRCVRGFQGVEGVTVDKATNQLSVTGNVDPWMLRDHVEAKTHKKVEIISPVKPPKKEIDGGDKKPASAAAGAGGDSKDQKKSKELVASTVVLQIRLHCHGCIQRIKKTILKVK